MEHKINFVKACEMFSSTSNYLKFLIDEIKQIPKEDIPEDIVCLSITLSNSLKSLSEDVYAHRKDLGCSKDCEKVIPSPPSANIAQTQNCVNDDIVHLENDNLSSGGSSHLVNSVIHPNFREYHEKPKENSQDTAFKYYCWCCKMLLFFKKNWKEHLSDKKHLAKAPVNLAIKLKCNLCNLEILGPVKPMKDHMRYHIETHYPHVEGKELPDYQSKYKNLVQSIPINPSNKEIETSDNKAPRRSRTQKVTLNNDEVESSSGTSDNVSNAKEIGDNSLWLTDKFKHVLKKLTDPSFSEYFYCRPCDILLKNSSNWVKHLNEDKLHLLKSKNKSNCELMCRVCSLTLFGNFVLMKKYMLHHNEIHGGIVANLEKLRNGLTKNIRIIHRGNSNLTYSQNSSLASSVNSLVSDTREKLGDQENTHFQNDDSHSSKIIEHENLINTGFDLNPSFPENRYNYYAANKVENPTFVDNIKESTFTTDVSKEHTLSNGSTLMTFIETLNKLEEVFRTKSLRVASSFCILCNCGINSDFDWIDHESLESHNDKITDKCETFICPSCGVKLFGEVKDFQKFLDSSEHLRIDEMFQMKH